jgi:hypothetical protein
MEQEIIETEKTTGRHWQRKFLFLLTALVAGVCIDAPGFNEGVRISGVEWTGLILLICGAMISITVLWRLGRDHSNQAAAWLLTSAGAGLFFQAFLILKVGAGAVQTTWWSVVLLAVAGVFAAARPLNNGKIWRWVFLSVVLAAWILPVRLYAAQNQTGSPQSLSTLASYEQAAEQPDAGMPTYASIVPVSNSLHPAVVPYRTVQIVLYSNSPVYPGTRQACPGSQTANAGSAGTSGSESSQDSNGTGVRSLTGGSGQAPRS